MFIYRHLNWLLTLMGQICRFHHLSLLAPNLTRKLFRSSMLEEVSSLFYEPWGERFKEWGGCLKKSPLWKSCSPFYWKHGNRKLQLMWPEATSLIQHSVISKYTDNRSYLNQIKLLKLGYKSTVNSDHFLAQFFWMEERKIVMMKTNVQNRCLRLDKNKWSH